MKWNEAPEVTASGSWKDAPEVGKPIGPADLVNWKKVGASMPTPAKAAISALNGWMPGFGDEAAGGLAAVASRIPFIGGDASNLPMADVYRGGRDIARGAQASYQKEHPILSTATEIGIGMAPGSLLNDAGKWIASKIPGGPVAKAIGTGGAFGAAVGAGSAGELADVPGAMAMGGSTGAAMGGATAGMMQGGSAVFNNLVKPRFSQPSAQEAAERRVIEALQRGGINDAQSAQREFSKLGPEARLADIGGKNTRNLLDLQTLLPGKTGDAVEAAIAERQRGRFGRLAGEADKLMSTGGARLGQTLEALDQQRSAVSRPLYDRVRQTLITPDDELNGLLERAKGAFGDAKILAGVRGEKFTLGESAGPMSLAELDTLKRTLYDKAYSNINPETGRLNEMGGAFNTLRRQLVDKLDKLTTDGTGQSFYKAARDAYAGPTELRTAASLGSQVMSKDSWKIGDLTKGMSQSELEAFRVGAMEALRKKVGTEGGQTSLLKLWKEPATAEKLQEIFPSKRLFQEFAETLEKERTLKLFEGVGRGSQTAARQAQLDDQTGTFMRDMGGMARDAGSGNIAGLLSAAQRAYGRATVPQPVRDQIGSLLLSREPQAQGLLGNLSIASDIAARRNAGLAGDASTLTAQLQQMLGR